MTDSEQYELASFVFKVASSVMVVAGGLLGSIEMVGIAYFLCMQAWWLCQFQIASIKKDIKRLSHTRQGGADGQ